VLLLANHIGIRPCCRGAAVARKSIGVSDAGSSAFDNPAAPLCYQHVH
jgi:hypothetical protein